MSCDWVNWLECFGCCGEWVGDMWELWILLVEMCKFLIVEESVVVCCMRIVMSWVVFVMGLVCL